MVLEQTEAALAGLRILVVEDNFLIADVIREILEASGSIVIGPAARVERALALADGTIDCAILDVNLAGGRSFPVAAKLGELRIPYLFVTGYDDDAALPADYRSVPRVGKPFSARALVAALIRELHRRAA